MELKLLFESIETILDKKYLLSRRFKILISKLGMSKVWESAIECAKNERAIVIISDNWSEYTDNWGALQKSILYLHQYFSVKEVIFFISSILEDYFNYSHKSFSTIEIKECLSILGATEEDLAELDSIFSHVTLEFNDMDNVISNFDDVNEFYLKMKDSHFNKNYRGTNTYAYTLLEGVLKGYLIYFEVSYERNDELRKLAKKVKQDIKDNRRVNELIEPALNQMTGIIETIDVCRNRASDSHCDSQSDMIMSSFIKDVAISVSNMILLIVNEDKNNRT